MDFLYDTDEMAMYDSPHSFFVRNFRTGNYPSLSIFRSQVFENEVAHFFFFLLAGLPLLGFCVPDFLTARLFPFASCSWRGYFNDRRLTLVVLIVDYPEYPRDPYKVGFLKLYTHCKIIRRKHLHPDNLSFGI